MEIEKVILVLMILVGVVVLILTVSLIVKIDKSEIIINSNMDNNVLNTKYVGTYYPGSSSGGVVLSSEVNVRNYCSQ